MKESSKRQVVLSGDVHVDPGPVRFPCSVCKKPVAATHRAVECDSCHQWCHIVRRCSNVSLENYKHMLNSNQDIQWIFLTYLSTVQASNEQLQQQQQMINGPEKLRSRFQQLKGEKNLLKVGHINIDGLLSKISEIKVIIIIEESDLDILSITETHLSAAISDDQLDMEGYEFARRGRKEDDFTKTHEGI